MADDPDRSRGSSPAASRSAATSPWSTSGTTPKDYSITYKESTNLDYMNGQIHRNYNGWIENLDRDIRANLLSL